MNCTYIQGLMAGGGGGGCDCPAVGSVFFLSFEMDVKFRCFRRGTYHTRMGFSPLQSWTDSQWPERLVRSAPSMWKIFYFFHSILWDAQTQEQPSSAPLLRVYLWRFCRVREGKKPCLVSGIA